MGNGYEIRMAKVAKVENIHQQDQNPILGGHFSLGDVAQSSKIGFHVYFRRMEKSKNLQTSPKSFNPKETKATEMCSSPFGKIDVYLYQIWVRFPF